MQKRKTFSEWYNNKTFQEVSYQAKFFDPHHDPGTSTEKDPFFGAKLPNRLTLTKGDREKVHRFSTDYASNASQARAASEPVGGQSKPGGGMDQAKSVEYYLNRATERQGIHWVLLWQDTGYEGGGVTRTNPLSPDQESDIYHKRNQEFGQSMVGPISPLQSLYRQYPKDYQDQVAPPSPDNTVVVAKATSRVHPLSLHFIIHNIGHAIWDNAERRGLSHKKDFRKAIEDAIVTLQRSHYDNTNTEPPSPNEIIVMLTRLLDHQALAKQFKFKPDDVATGKVLNTFINGINEMMYDLVGIYLLNQGKIPLRPRGEMYGKDRQGNPDQSKVVAPDRRGQMERIPAFDHPAAVESPTGGKVSDWAYAPIKADDAAWQEAGQKLADIVLAAIKEGTWSKVGGPLICHELITTA